MNKPHLSIALISYALTIGVLFASFRREEVKPKGDLMVKVIGQKNSDDVIPLRSVDSLINRTKIVEIPDGQRKLAFVHIGKSGGSTISLLLRNGCHQSVEGKPCEKRRWEKYPGSPGKVETIASKRIQFYLHTPAALSGKLAEYYSRITSIVMVGRDPLERFISAYLVSHPKNVDAVNRRNQQAIADAKARGETPPVWAKYFPRRRTRGDEIQEQAYLGCYPNIDEYAKCLNRPRGDYIYNATIRIPQIEQISLDCGQLARDIIMQRDQSIVGHARWGYQSFLRPLPSSKEVFFIRTKFLWQDWITINNMLGSRTDVPVPNKNETSSINVQGEVPIKSNLSEEGKKIICLHLYDEIRIYIEFLNRAVNLSDDDLRVSFKNLQKNCPDVVQLISFG